MIDRHGLEPLQIDVDFEFKCKLLPWVDEYVHIHYYNNFTDRIKGVHFNSSRDNDEH
jgi:hypothetical protein